jgi:protein-disulfide isomerase
MKFIPGPAIIAILGLAAVPAALAQGCCGEQSGARAGCAMGSTIASGGHEGHAGMQAVAASNQHSTPRKVFMEPVQSVFDNYIKVQGALAQDSLAGVAASAASMTKAIRADSMKMLSTKVAQQAESLAKAKDLQGARAAFKPLSESLIQFVKDQNVAPGAYYEAYCPMAKASWLQTEKTIVNPYLGKSMVHCGQIKT